MCTQPVILDSTLRSSEAAEFVRQEEKRIIRRGMEFDATYATGKICLASAHFKMNRLDESEKSAREAVLGKPDLPLAHLLLANIHIRKRDSVALPHDLDAYLKLEPNGPMSEPAV